MTWAFTTYCYLGFLFQSSNQSQLTTSPRQSWNCNGTSSARPVWEPGPSSRSLQPPFHRLSVPSCWNREESRLEPVDVDAGKVFQPSAPRPAAWHSPCLIWKTSFRLRLPSHSCPARALRALGLLLADVALTVHYVHFVKYDDAVSFYDAVSDTIRRRGGNRGIFTEEGVDTVAYFGGNHGSRVWKSLKLKKVYFPQTRTSWDKYMFNRKVFSKF